MDVSFSSRVGGEAAVTAAVDAHYRAVLGVVRDVLTTAEADMVA